MTLPALDRSAHDDAEPTGLRSLWATPLGVHRFAEAESVNPLLVRIFGALRAGQLAQATNDPPAGERSPEPAAPPAFFASDDQLLERIRLGEWQRLVRFFVECLRDTTRAANAGAWPAGGLDLRIAFQGMWFQMSSAGAFHDVHTHGNCSWSGVYIVQVDPAETRRRHPAYGAANGATRFYGPWFDKLAGAHVDLGNAYLQPPHLDIEPVPGQLVLFPAWLAHQALPYVGERERVIVSFNASVHAAHGSDQLHGYAAR